VQVPRYPLAQGQRIDLLVEIPKEGGAFPVFAQIEAAETRTGIILSTAGATVSRQNGTSDQPADYADLNFEANLRAATPLAGRKADRSFMLMLGEERGYRWTINGKVHGEHETLDAKAGERVELTFMNPTMMMHPMHLHGHYFQVVSIGGKRFSGPIRDTVIVPPHTPVTVAFDAKLKGDWFLHCHHLYHMAGGMMTDLRIS
jgi:FtsP/CotA-like multicopper oxidase with cupredoxin domain